MKIKIAPSIAMAITCISATLATGAALAQNPAAAPNPGLRFPESAPVGGADEIRLLLFNGSANSFVEQQPGESDQEFAGRCPRTVSLQIGQERAQIRREWPTTQRQHRLAMLENLRKDTQKDLLDNEGQVAWWQSEHDLNPNGLVALEALHIYERSVSTLRERLFAVEARIRSVEAQ